MILIYYILNLKPTAVCWGTDTVGKQNSVWNFIYRERPTSWMHEHSRMPQEALLS
jgi:hypothetical protein